MAKRDSPIYWEPELTEAGEQLTDELLAMILAPIIRNRLADGGESTL